jgi:uncharacterized protein YfaS (alpha-2-macroglobulin family)
MPLLSFCLALLLAIPLLASESAITVVESGIKASIQPGFIEVSLPFRNSGPAAKAKVHIELINPEDVTIARGEADGPIAPGVAKVVVRLALPEATGKLTDEAEDSGDNEALLWSRLHYRVTIGGTSAPVEQGTVALAAVAADLFELGIAHPYEALEDSTYQVRVHAANPVTRTPVAGVALQGKLASGSPDLKPLTISGLTNATGDAVLKFPIPKSLDTNSLEFAVEARKAGAVRKQDFTARVDSGLKIVVSTDKSLYQPGQKLHVRALMFDGNRQALAGKDTVFTLYDPERQVVFRSTGKSDRFGIASVDWELPANLRLGEYYAEARIGSSNTYRNQGAVAVRISRYELPTFAVTVKPDRTYYLPGQDADLDVAAMYLFDKPVTQGTVRVVREDERQWDFKAQKWQLKEGETFTGTLDASGHFKLHVGLKERYQDFAGEQQRFLDVTYAAYVTDTTTGRMEQRRVQLRLSHDPIHVYITDAGSLNGRATFYVSTFYPDGAPARCHVQVSEVDDNEDYDAPAAQIKHGPVLGAFDTNRYGVAKVENFRVAAGREEDAFHHIFVQAVDRSGARTQFVETLRREREILLSTDKTVYRHGEPIEVSLASVYRHGTVILEIGEERGVLLSQTVRLRNGNAFVIIPYRPQFQGELRVEAYSLEHVKSSYGAPVAARGIIYPRDQELKLRLRPEKASYRPGEEFTAAVQVRMPDGTAQASAVGIAVVDKAVEERARTDDEFGSGYYGFWNWGWWYDMEGYGGVSRADLAKLDLSIPVPDDLQLVAEVLLFSPYGYGYNLWLDGYDFDSENAGKFRDRIDRLLDPVRDALRERNEPGWSFPRNLEELRRQLKAKGIDLAEIKDPWAKPFQFTFDVDERNLIVEATSAGPDKEFGTADDIGGARFSWPFFTPVGRLIDRAITEAYARDGAIVRDYATLRSEVLELGMDLDAQRDPKGNAYEYKFAIDGRNVQVEAYRALLDTASAYTYRPRVWSDSIDYFSKARQRIDRALAESANYPRTADELEAVLRPEGVALSQLRDPWGHPYYAVFSSGTAYSDYQVIEAGTGKRSESKPVERLFDHVTIRSAGPDGVPNTKDDFEVASFARMVSEQSGAEITSHAVSGATFTSGLGAVRGTVTDASGAVIVGSKVKLTRAGGPTELDAQVDPNGEFLFRDLDPGVYRLEISHSGFSKDVVSELAVYSSSETVVNVSLRVERTTETVMVAAQASGALQTESAAVGMLVSRMSAGAAPQVPNFTPRVREYFPETLYWAPALVTDHAGNTRLKFNLADSITTWKFSLVASTVDGHVGATEAEIAAFQPFFVEHAPPRILTAGDEIHLPVVVRNYLEKAQTVDVEMKPADWMALLNPAKQSITVPAGGSKDAIFPFRALGAIADGKQRVTASNRSLGDAIEKPVTVHPDGQERSIAVSDVITGQGKLEFEVPSQAIAGSLHAELKLYPGLLANLADSIEAGMERPYGCGEQTISSTYPSLLLLRYYRDHKLAETAASQRAHKYLEQGYQRLLNYRAASGGFTYWGRGDADPALTAYALRFLSDAAEFIEVDRELATAARKWLLQQQAPDGSWTPRHGSAATLTGYAARVLAMTAAETPSQEDSQALSRARQYLQSSAQAMLDPYSVAEAALTALAAKDAAHAAAALDRLRSMAHHEGNGVYWDLESNTPFYGWGRAGRVETTALALQALASAAPEGATGDPLIQAGLQFLFKERDRYGVWYSGQSTVNVLGALLQLLKDSDTAMGGKATVLVNGKPAGTLDFPTSPALAVPLALDISRWVAAGANRVDLQLEGARATVNLAATSTYYVPWAAGALNREVTEPGESRGLRLAVRFDKTAARPGDEVRCHVEAERIGHRGYGMLLAEIGLPPGAEVDRAPLNKAMEGSWDVNRYDVLPDRVVLYLWPSAGGAKVDFTFRPRFGMKAKSAPSVLYDYYNPEAQAVVPPETFRVD